MRGPPYSPKKSLNQAATATGPPSFLCRPGRRGSPPPPPNVLKNTIPFSTTKPPLLASLPVFEKKPSHYSSTGNIYYYYFTSNKGPNRKTLSECQREREREKSSPATKKKKITMLDGILGRGFSAKCKSLMKQAKSRIEVIRRKKKATLKFLKKDMADLLANGLDINAYGRAEGLMAELTLSSCYDYVELSIDFVMKHLAVMQKMRHCPEDCRQAVASLMVAASRFSDLPELRELRQIFYERYGSSLEIFATKEFVENLSSKPSTMEKKVRLMQDIASEFSIRWDAKAFQEKKCKPSSSAQEQHQPKVYGSFHANDDKYKSVNGLDTVANIEKDDAASKRRVINDGCRLPIDSKSNIVKRNELNVLSNRDVLNSRYGSSNAFEENVMKRANSDILFQGRQEATSPKHDLQNGEASVRPVRSGSASQSKRNRHVNTELNNLHDDNLPKGDRREKSISKYPSIGAERGQSWSESDGKNTLVGNPNNSFRDNPTSTKNEEGTHKLRHCHGSALPPPYTKPPSAGGKDVKHGANIDLSHPCSDGNSMHKDHLRNEMKRAGNLPEKIHQDTYYADREGQGVAPAARKHESGNSHPDALFNPATPLPKPRSSRRKHSKSHSNHEDVGRVDDAEAVKRRSRSRRRDDSRRGLQILFDDDHHKKNDEEQMIDKLLFHYSTKPSASEPEKARNSRRRHAHKQHAEAGEGVSKDALDEITDVPTAPRSVSLPREQPTQSEPKKVFTRAATFQADRYSPARHVHPKLPDYDDLAARFAALKGS